jgi:hypothetical protein
MNDIEFFLTEVFSGRMTPAQKQDARDAALLELAEREQERDALIHRLEALTPGGSEFAGDADACLRFVEDRMRTVMQVAKERNELRAALELCEEQLAAITEKV